MSKNIYFSQKYSHLFVYFILMEVQKFSLIILFISSDGCGRSGAIAATVFCIERLKVEGIVDVFQTVRMMRTQRPHVIRTLVS